MRILIKLLPIIVLINCQTRTVDNGFGKPYDTVDLKGGYRLTYYSMNPPRIGLTKGYSVRLTGIDVDTMIQDEGRIMRLAFDLDVYVILHSAAEPSPQFIKVVDKKRGEIIAKGAALYFDTTFHKLYGVFVDLNDPKTYENITRLDLKTLKKEFISYTETKCYPYLDCFSKMELTDSEIILTYEDSLKIERLKIIHR